MKICNIASLVLVAVLFVGTSVRAAGDAATVTVTGTASAPEKAQILRMTVVISAQGSDIRDATAKLKQQRDQAKAKLLITGATESSIKFADPAEGGGTLTPQQQMIQRMMMARQSGAPASQPSGVTVSSELTAEWPITDATPDDLLVAIDDLETKIKAAIPKADQTAPKTPEEQEIAQELAAQQGSDATATNDPKFVFVHKLTDDDRAKLYAQAFTSAQGQAKLVAVATGKQLGSLIHVSNTKADTQNPQDEIVQAMMDVRSGDVATPSDDEVVGDQPGNVDYAVSLVTTFSVQ